MIWRNVTRFPNVEEVCLLRPEENRDFDFQPIQINPKGKSWASTTYHNLQYLKFTNAVEISDRILLYILPNLPQLSRLFLYECKLVTCSGKYKYIPCAFNHIIHIFKGLQTLSPKFKIASQSWCIVTTLIAMDEQVQMKRSQKTPITYAMH